MGEWTEAITPCLQVCAGEKTDETISECISNVASQIASGLGLDTDSLLRSHLQNGDSETEDSGLPEPPTADEIATAEHIADATYDEKCAAYDKFFEVPGGGEGIKIRFNNGIPQEAGATFDKTDPSRRECPPSHPKRIFESHEGNGKSCETVPVIRPRHIKSCDLVKDPNTDYTERDAGQNLFHHLCYQDDDDESGWPIIRDPKKRNCPKDYPTFWLSPPPATPHQEAGKKGYQCERCRFLDGDKTNFEIANLAFLYCDLLQTGGDDGCYEDDYRSSLLGWPEMDVGLSMEVASNAETAVKSLLKTIRNGKKEENVALVQPMTRRCVNDDEGTAARSNFQEALKKKVAEKETARSNCWHKASQALRDECFRVNKRMTEQDKIEFKQSYDLREEQATASIPEEPDVPSEPDVLSEPDVSSEPDVPSEPEVPSAPGRAQNDPFAENTWESSDPNDPFAENSETDENFNNMGEDGLPGKKWTPGTENSIDEAKSANDPLSGWGVQGKDEAAAGGEQTVASTPQNIKTLFATTASTSVDESRKTEKNALREVQHALEADGQKMELMEAKYATRPTTTKQTDNTLREVQHALKKEGQKMESAMEARK